MMRHLYCTAGAGMEELLAEEVQHKLCASQVEQIPGRVFFCCEADLYTVTQLKSAERLFLLLRKAEPISLPKNPAKAAAVIKERVVGDPDIWKQALLTWTALQKELQSSQQRGYKRRREEDEEERLTVADESTHTLTSSTHLLNKTSEMDKESYQHTPSFRVSCRCSGVIARSYTAQRLSRIIGMAIKEHLGWKVDLREPVFEVNVYLSDDHCVVGIPLLKRPLASRSYMKHNGLRSTIAWAMTSLCPKQNAVFLGMDTETSQLQKAAENLKASGMEGRVQLLRSSAIEIPLADGTVDVVLCDVPFGRKFSCSSDMPTALPHLLREMERVIRVGGHLVLLLSLQLSAQLKKIICTHKHNQHLNSSDTNNVHTDPSNICNESTDKPKALTFHKSSSEALNTPLLISSLQAQRTHKVSLGSTDAFIHTYTKIQHSH
ncbi:U6 snRNA (guanine-N(2))-methyltransferase THUMPD2 isoform X3 [Siphateles boraxobius]|uniref:U6 snRNA (guanine-N(2))-methyltransferase THUMPD2 isoform X3 n=1 Tax=Siphateles boraxobius TaxID=180520 RepID=UPI004063AA7B